MQKEHLISVKGKNIKSYNVIVNDSEIIIPVVPGHKGDVEPVFTFSDDVVSFKSVGTADFSAPIECVVKYTDGHEETVIVKTVEWGNSPLGEYGVFGDPGIIPLDGKFYIYPTTDGINGWQSTLFHTFSSSDLLHWTDEGVILDFADIPWTGGVMAWAPSAIERNGKYYFYYSGGRYGYNETGRDGGRNIGVAVADTPNGPFTDIGYPLVPAGTRRGQMIDPQVYIDDDGTPYLYWGNGGLYVAKLAEDMISLDGEIYTITPEHFTEGVFVVKRNGKYYFTWSEGNTERGDYRVRWGVSDSPIERPQGSQLLIHRDFAKDPRIMCTGHHSILNVPGTDEWYVCYHRFNIPTTVDFGEGLYAGSHREPALDRLHFDDDGNMIPVIPTLEGITEPVHYGVVTSGNVCDYSALRAGDEITIDVTVMNNDGNGVVSVKFDIIGGDGTVLATDTRSLYVDTLCSVSIKETMILPADGNSVTVKISTLDEGGADVCPILFR